MHVGGFVAVVVVVVAVVVVVVVVAVVVVVVVVAVVVAVVPTIVVGAAVVVGSFLEAEQASEWGSKTREIQAMITTMTLPDRASMVTATRLKVYT